MKTAPAIGLLLGLFVVTAVSAHPNGGAGARSGARGRGGTISRAMNFLTRFGYLPQSDLETGNLRTEEQLKEAIREMQRFGNIPVTGEIDTPTLELMRRKRCGNFDVEPSAARGSRHKRYALQGSKWSKTDLTWSISHWTSSMDRGTVRQEIGKALRIWSDASKLTFTEVSSDSADLVVAFHRSYHGDGYPFDGPGAVLAHAFFPGEGRGGDTHFDDEESWIVGTRNKDDGVSLLAVAAHEFGHSLGLSHSSVPEALMFPYYQGIKDSLELPYDDHMGIQQLYGSREERPWATMSPNVPKPPPRKPATPASTTTPWPVSEPKVPEEPEEGEGQPRGGRASTRAPEHGPTQSPEQGIADTCDMSYDAVSVIRQELFIFKGKFFWRLDKVGLMKDYPVEITRFWADLPAGITHIDAVYERPKDRKIVFFIGKQYWMFDANVYLPGYPKNLTTIGIPDDVERIDAAMVWGHNGKTYLFSGTMYWRFDEDEQRVELDYPRDMSMWRGVPYNIDAAFQWSDGHTYFFKDKVFWKFNDRRMRVENKHPAASAQTWMKCPHGGPKKENEVPRHHEPKSGHPNGGHRDTNSDRHDTDHHGTARDEAVTSSGSRIAALMTSAMVPLVALMVHRVGITA